MESVPLGDLILERPSSVIPFRSSRKTVTTRLISSTASGIIAGSRRRRAMTEA